MYIAMNRFKVKHGHEEEFETMWRNRDSYLKDMEGFKDFHLLKGPDRDDHRLYSSHTVWASEEAFMEWTRSQAFRGAHKTAGQHKHMYLEGPHFEGFSSVLTMSD